MKKIFTFLLSIVASMVSIDANAAVEGVNVGGWFEGGYVTWTKVAGYSYNVYVSPFGEEKWSKLDAELVREYPTQGRADAVGITAGTYKFKIVPVKDGAEVAADATETAAFIATAYDRGGFAHFKSSNPNFNPANGIGAYKNDGTLKAGAKVIYVTANNAKTITTDVITDTKGGKTTGVGLQGIIKLYEKGCDKTPIDFRIIGTIKGADMDAFGSKEEGLQIKGRNSYSEVNITIEGIGSDATIHGFGMLVRNCCSLELRNFAVMWALDDAVSMDTDNCNLWVHNLDLFYGKPGSASDQAKGDGTLDIKGDSQYSTLSYNHLWDSGKSSLCGMTSESGPNYLTYHHNWFDHSDSRHPRVRTMTVHVYNNYFDGNAKYGVGAAKSSNVFVENNYFRNCKYPMLISKQGTDVNNGTGTSDQTKGTFSGEDGGMIKAYGNYMTGEKRFQAYKAGDPTNSIHFDAFVATSRDEKVPSTIAALQGGRKYDNFDTNEELMYKGYTCHAASEVKNVVTGELGAGRCQHGDFSWTFGTNEDTNDQVIAALSDAINNYKSKLVGFFGQAISNGGATGEQGGSSDQGNTGGADDESIGEDIGEDNNEKDYSGMYIVQFAYDGKTLSCSDNTLVQLVTANGKKGLSVAYNGKTYTSGTKMESATNITIKPVEDCTIYLVFDAASTKLKIDGTSYTTDANGIYSFKATKGTTYTLTKGDSMNLVAVAFDFEGGESGEQGGSQGGEGGGQGGQGGGTSEDSNTSGLLINYPAKLDGITIKGSTTEGSSVIQLKNGYVGTVNGEKQIGNGILLKVEGGFKAGDVVTIAGKITVKTDDAKYDTKVATTAKIATINAENNELTDDIYKFGKMVNTVESSAAPADQQFKLTQDYPELWIVRDGGTTLSITKLTVTRPEGDGVVNVITNATATPFGNNTIFDLQGRRISQPVKNQLYIKEGKKYLAK